MVDFLVPDSWASSGSLPERTVYCPRTSTLGPTHVQGYGVRLVSIGRATLAPGPIRNERTGRAAPRVWRRTVRLGKIEFDVPDSLIANLHARDRIRVHLGEDRRAVSLFREGQLAFAFGALVGADLGDRVRVEAGLDIRARRRRTLPIPGGGLAPLDDTCLTIFIGGEILGVTADGPAEHDHYDIWMRNLPNEELDQVECLAIVRRGTCTRETALRAADMLDVMGVRENRGGRSGG